MTAAMVDDRLFLREWVTEAACNGFPPEWWDAPEPLGDDATDEDRAERERLIRARRVLAAERCAICPVRAECLADARRHHLPGIHGGHVFGAHGTRDSINLLAPHAFDRKGRS